MTNDDDERERAAKRQKRNADLFTNTEQLKNEHLEALEVIDEVNAHLASRWPKSHDGLSSTNCRELLRSIKRLEEAEKRVSDIERIDLTSLTTRKKNKRASECPLVVCTPKLTTKGAKCMAILCKTGKPCTFQAEDGFLTCRYPWHRAQEEELKKKAVPRVDSNASTATNDQSPILPSPTSTEADRFGRNQDDLMEELRQSQPQQRDKRQYKRTPHNYIDFNVAEQRDYRFDSPEPEERIPRGLPPSPTLNGPLLPSPTSMDADRLEAEQTGFRNHDEFMKELEDVQTEIRAQFADVERMILRAKLMEELERQHKRKADEEAKAKRKAKEEAEAKRKAEEEEEAKRRAEEEKRKADEEEKRKAEEETRMQRACQHWKQIFTTRPLSSAPSFVRRAEEAKRKADEESRRKAEEADKKAAKRKAEAERKAEEEENARALIEAQADMDKLREDLPPLHYAAGRGHVDNVRALIEAGADVDRDDGEGATPLHYAYVSGHVDVVLALIEAGADQTKTVNCPGVDWHGFTARDLAINHGDKSVVRVIDEANRKAEAERKAEEEETMRKAEEDDDTETEDEEDDYSGPDGLINAIEDGKTKIAIDLIRNSNVDVNYANQSGWTALHAISTYGDHDDDTDTEAFKALLDKNPNVNAQDAKGWTPLHCAVHWKHAEAVKILLRAGADPFAKNKEGDTPLETICRYEHSSLKCITDALKEAEKENKGKPSIRPRRECTRTRDRAKTSTGTKSESTDADAMRGARDLTSLKNVSSSNMKQIMENYDKTDDNRLEELCKKLRDKVIPKTIEEFIKFHKFTLPVSVVKGRFEEYKITCQKPYSGDMSGAIAARLKKLEHDARVYKADAELFGPR